MEELLDIAEELCDGYCSMPSGCEGCPLFDWDKAPNFDYEKDCPLYQIKNRYVVDKIE
jgi:hypothetical protein